MTTTIDNWKARHPRWIYKANHHALMFYLELSNEEQLALVEIHRMAKTLHRIAENQCNGHPRPVIEYRDGKRFEYSVEDESWRQRDEKTENRIESRLKDIALRFGWKIETQGDPRGAVVHLEINGKDMTDFIFA